MRKHILLLQFIFALIICVSSVSAQVMIEQGKIVVKVNPGETVVDTLTIHNISKNNLILRIYLEDFMYVEPFDGKKEFFAAGTSDRSLSQWINYSPQQFSIEPSGAKKITYSIKIPEDAKGGYYGVLFVEDSSDKVKDRFGVSIVTRMGSLFFVETTDSTRQGKVEKIEYKDKGFVGEFKNLGDVVLIPDATYYIMDNEGLVAERGDISKFYLAAEKTTSFSVPTGEKLLAGEYSAVLTFDYGDGENTSSEFDFRKDDNGTITITKSPS